MISLTQWIFYYVPTMCKAHGRCASTKIGFLSSRNLEVSTGVNMHSTKAQGGTRRTMEIYSVTVNTLSVIPRQDRESPQCEGQTWGSSGTYFLEGLAFEMAC